MNKKLFTTVAGRVYTNSYLVVDENNNAIIFDIPDTAGEKLYEFCQKNNIKPLAILLTHGHFDHCGGVMAFLRHKNIPVYCHKDDEFLANNASKNHFRLPAEDCKITNYVEDGQIIKIADFEILVMHTPGHTPGSVCYFLDDLMFSGDTLFKGCIGRIDFEESVPQKMPASLQKIANIDKDYKVYPGHEESTTLFDEKQNNYYLK